MTRYEVTIWEKVTYTIQVDAESEEEATEIAETAVCDGEVEGIPQGFYARIVNETGDN